MLLRMNKHLFVYKRSVNSLSYEVIFEKGVEVPIRI